MARDEKMEKKLILDPNVYQNCKVGEEVSRSPHDQLHQGLKEQRNSQAARSVSRCGFPGPGQAQRSLNPCHSWRPISQNFAKHANNRVMYSMEYSN